MTPWLSVIGIGEDGLSGLSPAARTLVDTAEILIGGERHLAMVPANGCERLSWPTPLSALVERIPAMRGRRVCVLATGDPMQFGIGTTLTRHVQPEEMTVFPGVSAFTLAAARLAWPLDKNSGWANEKAFVEFAGNLRPGFKTLYNEPNNYPFTIGSQSFVVESLGMINRSGSSIQKMIKVAVALTRGKGGTVDNTITNIDQCNKTAGRFWDIRTQRCTIKPRNAQECMNTLAGTPIDVGGRMACQLNNQQPVFFDDNTVAGAGGTGAPATGGGGTTPTVEEPNAMKIIYWYES